MNILSFVEPNLLPWVLVANVAGYWLKQKKLAKWIPPVPLVIFLFNFMVCTAMGWALTEASGWRAIVIAILEYGLGNGLVITFISTFGYDLVHAFKKRHIARKEEKEGQDV